MNKWKAKGMNDMSGIYGLGAIGAIVYYVQQSTSFWTGVLGFLKGLVWPAMLLHRVFEQLKM
jgi:hypothetical protein